MTDHAARSHARFGASSAHRWFACPGSVRLTDGIPDRPSAAALEGTRAHELLEVLLRCDAGGNDGADVHEAEEHWNAAPQEMRDGVQLAVDYVRDLLEEHPDAVLFVERRFEIPVAAAPGEVFGTCDAVVFVPSMRALHVVDFKYGAGTFVEVRGNKQLRFYALGALAASKWAPAHWERAADDEWAIDSVCLTVIQPRCAFGEPVREEWLPVEEVLAFGPEIGRAIERCKAPDAPLVPGEEQCRFCAAAASCPARERLALETVGEDFGAVEHVNREAMLKPRGLTSERLGGLLRVRADVESWFQALEDEARRRLEAGEDVAGFKLVEAQARRQWEKIDEDDQVNTWQIAERLAEVHGAIRSDAFVAEKVRTLTEVEAILKRGVSKTEARRRLDAMAFLTTKKSSGALKVVGADDPRPAVDRARDDFGGVALIEHGGADI